MKAESDRTGGRRLTILAAAARVFDAHGYAEATIDAVAAEANISKGSVYNYFQSKQDLFAQVFAQSFAEDEAAADRIVAEPRSALYRLERLFDMWFTHQLRYQKVGGLVLEFWANAARQGDSGSLGSFFREQYSRWRKRLTTIIAQGLEAAEFAREFEPEIAATLIMGMLDGIIVHAILDVGVVVDEAFLSSLKRAIAAGMTLRASNTGNSQIAEDAE